MAQEIADELPERIGIDKSKRRYLLDVKQGGEKDKKKPAPKKKKSSASSSLAAHKKEWKHAAEAAASSLNVEKDADGDEREPLEIIEDEDDYD